MLDLNLLNMFFCVADPEVQDTIFHSSWAPGWAVACPFLFRSTIFFPAHF